MPIHISWDDTQQTITRLEFQGVISFGEVIDAWEKELELFNSVSHPVYSLNVFGAIPLSLKGFNIRRLRAFAMSMQVDHLQMTVQSAESPMLRHFLHTMKLPMAKGVYVVQSLDEAYSIINAHKVKNEWLLKVQL